MSAGRHDFYLIREASHMPSYDAGPIDDQENQE